MARAPRVGVVGGGPAGMALARSLLARSGQAVLVVVDTPRTGVYYGGVVAGPIFKDIAEAAIRHLGIPPSIDPQPPVMVVREREQEPVPAAGPVRMPDLVQVRRANILPDVRGMSARDAVATLAKLGVRPRIKGSGYVVDQQPVAGTPCRSGRTTTCWRRLPRVTPVTGSLPVRPWCSP